MNINNLIKKTVGELCESFPKKKMKFNPNTPSNRPIKTDSESMGDPVPRSVDRPNPGGMGYDVEDMLALIAQWGECPGCEWDLNGDGFVNVADLLLLVAGWGDADSPDPGPERSLAPFDNPYTFKGITQEGRN
tara:strand:+ start:1030 stop:1428 length:399 start_codon:yes stop_codon:yes gene_type:complete